MKKLIAIMLLASSVAHAELKFEFDGLTQNQIDSIGKDLSSNFAHAPVSGAAPLGDIFGFEIGLVGGMTDFSRTAKLSSSSAGETKFYNMGLALAFSVPMGITFEMNYFALPLDSFEISNTTFGLKYTLPKMVSMAELAIRGHYGKFDLEFSQTMDNAGTPVTGKVKSESKTYGVVALASLDFPVVNPYIGLGFIKGDTNLNVTAAGTATIFDSSINISGSNGAKSDYSSIHFMVGTEVDLIFLKFGVQYESLFGTSRTMGKLSFGF